MSRPAPLSRRRWLLRSLLSLATVYLLICAMMVVGQRWLLFHPTTMDELQARAIEQRAEIEPLAIQTDGELLRGVLLRGRGPEPRPTVLYFGGNGEAVWQRTRDQGWVGEHGWNLALVSYRGYDRSSGSASADALLADALAIYDVIAARPEVDPDHIVAWGFSLGTGVVAHLAHQRVLDGVILAAPYARLSDVGAALYPWLPVRWLFRHEIDTLARAPAITEPALLVHGNADTLIPIEHSHRIAEAWAGPTRLVVVPKAGHNALFGHRRVRDAVVAFLGERLP